VIAKRPHDVEEPSVQALKEKIRMLEADITTLKRIFTSQSDDDIRKENVDLKAKLHEVHEINQALQAELYALRDLNASYVSQFHSMISPPLDFSPPTLMQDAEAIMATIEQKEPLELETLSETQTGKAILVYVAEVARTQPKISGGPVGSKNKSYIRGSTPFNKWGPDEIGYMVEDFQKSHHPEWLILTKDESGMNSIVTLFNAMWMLIKSIIERPIMQAMFRAVACGTQNSSQTTSTMYLIHTIDSTRQNCETAYIRIGKMDVRIDIKFLVTPLKASDAAIRDIVRNLETPDHPEVKYSRSMYDGGFDANTHFSLWGAHKNMYFVPVPEVPDTPICTDPTYYLNYIDNNHRAQNHRILISTPVNP
jgi:hypothetical protein